MLCKVDGDVLQLLTMEDASMWTVDEIARELHDSVAAADAVGSLTRAGLAHRTADGFVFASHAGVAATQLGLA